MHVIHFTEGATDPVQEFSAHGVRLVTLADGAGADETYVSCLHFEPGGWISDPPVVRDGLILLVHGEAGFRAEESGLPLQLVPGLGLVMNADQRYRLRSSSPSVLSPRSEVDQLPTGLLVSAGRVKVYVGVVGRCSR